MKKTQKGITLVEVIVAIAVFAIISLALFSSVFAMKNVVARQEEYLKLEMVCQDINALWKNNSTDWDFNADKVYLTSKFIKANDFNEASYVIKFQIVDNNNTQLLLSIYNIDETITFVENVICDRGGVTNEEK